MRRYFPNLNSLRFVAASLVIIHHVESGKHFFKLDNLYQIDFFEIIGKLGVVLFFVLSGFLITSLLLQEYEEKNSISFKKFYMRRILRIWPLYYLIVLLGFYVYPYLPFFRDPYQDLYINVLESRSSNIYYYLSIFANLGVVKHGLVAYTSHVWSIATEEQFYLLWPLLFSIFNKRLLKMMVGVILFYWTIKYIIVQPPVINRILEKEFAQNLRDFWYFFNINCMAIGGIFAYILHNKYRIVKLILNRYTFYTATLITVFFLAFGLQFGFFHYEVYSVLFAVIISNLALNPKFKKTLDLKTTNYLGSISYGLYMLHPPILLIAIKIGAYFHSYYLLPYLITFGGTILISHLSYQYFESPFLKLKSKFL